MCQSPVKILNPKLAWTPFDPKYLVVECGRCFECRARKQQEWFVRSYYEFKKNKAGSNFFFTLTFDNKHLPVYEDKRDFQFIEKHGVVVKVKKPVDYKFQCFDQRLTTLFLKRFRSNLQREFPNVDVSGIKYFIACEFGENTHRSHLHGDFFIPLMIPEYKFKDLLCRSWQQGFVGASRKGGFQIKSISALEYTAKYSTKDLYFFDRVISDYLDKDKLSSAEYNYRYERVKDHLPRLRVSSGFGSGLIEELKNDPKMFEKLLSVRPLQLPKKNGNLRDFLIPRYVINKLVKKVDKYFSDLLGRPYFTLTDIGFVYKKKLLLTKIDRDVCDINFITSSSMLNSLSAKSEYDRWWIKNVKGALAETIKSLDSNKISIYKNVLRYLPVSEYGKHSADWYFRRSKQIIDSMLKITIPIELRNALMNDCVDKYSSEEYDFYFKGANEMIFDSLGQTYNISCPLKDLDDDIQTLSQLGEFQKYERFCKILDDYNKWVCSYRCKERRSKQDRIDTIRNAFADFVLYDMDGFCRQVV